MFDSIRDKFHSLQENLTTTLRGFSATDSSLKRPINKVSSINFNAGTEILDRFQTSWAQLHELSQENATKGIEVDNTIYQLHRNIEKQWKDISLMTNILTSLPEVVYLLDGLCDKVTALEGLFETVEKALIQLEDIIDTRNFQNKQLEQRFQLALYKEKKLAQLEAVKLSLAEEHTNKVRKHELKQQRLLKECQEASEENFKQDLKMYQEKKVLPTIEFVKSKNSNDNTNEKVTLEDITLDAEDPTALDEFLNDSKEEETEKS